jgi:hypothetical protein
MRSLDRLFYSFVLLARKTGGPDSPSLAAALLALSIWANLQLAVVVFARELMLSEAAPALAGAGAGATYLLTSSAFIGRWPGIAARIQASSNAPSAFPAALLAGLSVSSFIGSVISYASS